MGQGLVYVVQRYGDLYSNTSVVLMVDNQSALQITVPWAHVANPSTKVYKGDSCVTLMMMMGVDVAFLRNHSFHHVWFYIEWALSHRDKDRFYSGM